MEAAMLVETIVTVVITGFATIAVFGHVLLLQAAFAGHSRNS
jgi:hypothetical protein